MYPCSLFLNHPLPCPLRVLPLAGPPLTTRTACRLAGRVSPYLADGPGEAARCECASGA